MPLHVHPTEAGFTVRHEWRGRSRVPVYRHCGEDARQGSKRFRGRDGVLYTVHVCCCEVCGLYTVTADPYTLIKYDEALNSDEREAR